MTAFRAPWNLALLATLAVLTIVGFVSIPSGKVLPIRWGLDLTVTEWAARDFALLQMPAAALLVWGVVWLFLRFGNQERAARNAASMKFVLPTVTALFLAAQVAIVTAGLS
jgi:hypothetical protein